MSDIETKYVFEWYENATREELIKRLEDNRKANKNFYQPLTSMILNITGPLNDSGMFYLEQETIDKIESILKEKIK